MPHQVEIVMGSSSDTKTFKESGMAEILDEVGLTYAISICSAHRNSGELSNFAYRACQDGAQVFIGIAGMAAALPGALAGLTGMVKPVIAVPLDEHGINSVIHMPPGVPVMMLGVGKPGLKNAAIAACQILATGDRKVQDSLQAYIAKANPPAQFNILP